MPKVFEGNAVAQQGDVTLRADSIRAELGPSIHPALPGKLMRLIADGNVELTTPKGTIRAGHMEIPVVDNGLQVENGKAEGGNVIFEEKKAALTPPLHAVGRTTTVAYVAGDAGPPINVAADKFTPQTDSSGVRAFHYEGDVVLQQGDITIRATSIRGEVGPSTVPGTPGKLRRLIADGNVELTTPKGTIRAGHMEIPVVDSGLQLENSKVEGSNVSSTRRVALTPPPLPPGPPPPPPPSATMNLARLLLPLPPGAAKDAIDNAMKISMQIRQATDSCATLEKVSQDPLLKGSVFMKLGQYVVANLHPDLQRALLETKPGGIANPVQLAAGVEIFARCD
jgi:lipopolysaccharide export system protein LptA